MIARRFNHLPERDRIRGLNPDFGTLFRGNESLAGTARRGRADQGDIGEDEGAPSILPAPSRVGPPAWNTDDGRGPDDPAVSTVRDGRLVGAVDPAASAGSLPPTWARP
jgi:hypothetical protein